MPPPNRYYCRIEGQELGPFSPTDIRKLASTGQLKPSDELRKAPSTDWLPASKYKGLFPGGESSPAPSQPAAAASAASTELPTTTRSQRIHILELLRSSLTEKDKALLIQPGARMNQEIRTAVTAAARILSRIDLDPRTRGVETSPPAILVVLAFTESVLVILAVVSQSTLFLSLSVWMLLPVIFLFGGPHTEISRRRYVKAVREERGPTKVDQLEPKHGVADEGRLRR